MPAEEVHRESKAEHTAHADGAGAGQQGVHDRVPDSQAPAVFPDRDRPDLGQVLPHYVQRAAAARCRVSGKLGHAEFLYVLVEGDGGLAQQAP